MTEQQQIPEDTTTEIANVETVMVESMTDNMAIITEELTKKLEDSQTKADQYWNQLLRVRAEMENLQKRQTRELENAHRFALDGFVRELLQVWDSLELGLTAAQAKDTDVAKLQEGMELTLKLCGDVMGKFGVQRLDPIGMPFNPDYHQAMAMQSCSDTMPNQVVMVMQKGCTLNGRLVRPALVVVSQTAKQET